MKTTVVHETVLDFATPAVILRHMWWKEAKIYELYIDKFAGNIKTLTARLDYFNTLGVNTLHILPHYPSPMIDEGYDVSDYRGVREELGTLDDFKVLLDTAHKKGIRIITDLVINHTSDQHPWFKEARVSKQNGKRDYYLWSDTGTEFGDAPNMFPHLKPHNWIRNDLTSDHYFATFYPAQPDLNWNNEEVLREVLEIMSYWADLGVDGFRIDAAAHIIKKEGTNSTGLPETHAVLKRIRAALEKRHPNVILLAESGREPEKYFGDGDECHMVYDFALMRHMWLALMTGDRKGLDTVIASRSIPQSCAWATFLRNHDEISLATFSGEQISVLQKLLDPQGVYLFHDYPAVRVAEAFGGNKERIIEAFKMFYSISGAPVTYYGDEIGMRNLSPAQGVTDTRLYVRGSFDWNEAERQIHDPTSLFNATAAILHGPLVPAKERSEPAVS